MSTLPTGRSSQPAQPVPFLEQEVILRQPGADRTPASWERRLPPVVARPVVPAAWLRRMPGGGTTYAPPVDGIAADH